VIGYSASEVARHSLGDGGARARVWEVGNLSV